MRVFYFLYPFSFQRGQKKKTSEEGKREDDGRGEVREEEGEVMRCGENEGGRGREDREG